MVILRRDYEHNLCGDFYLNMHTATNGTPTIAIVASVRLSDAFLFRNRMLYRSYTQKAYLRRLRACKYVFNAGSSALCMAHDSSYRLLLCELSEEYMVIIQYIVHRTLVDIPVFFVINKSI